VKQPRAVGQPVAGPHSDAGTPRPPTARSRCADGDAGVATDLPEGESLGSPVADGSANARLAARPRDRSYPRLELEPLAVGKLLVDPNIVRILPEGLVRQYRAVPVRVEDGDLVLATCGPLDLAVLDQMEMVSGHRIQPILAPEREIRRAIERYFTVDRSFDESFGEAATSAGRRSTGGAISLDERLGGERDAPAVRLVDSIVRGAARQGASDIHVEPVGGDLVVRYRLDGMLREVMSVSGQLQEEVVSRIKLLSGLDITEHRMPQDGRISVRIEGAEYDLRVSTLLTVRGEKVAIRLLNKSSGGLTLGQLGMTETQQKLFAGLIAHPYGMILLTGPTGSGKTTTLYAALQDVDRLGLNVTTIEDPVEYWLDHVNQIQVNEAAGMTFASALRTVLRQDPDIVMVGEIRDTETARLAVQAAMTGHLVFSTLHANDAASTLARLRDLDVPPFLIASTVLASISQRLVRRICADCRETYTPPKDQVAGTPCSERFPLLQGTPLEGKPLVRGAGCDLCMNTGYRGRLGIFEIFPVAEALREAFLEGRSSDALRAMAYEGGVCSMREAAIEAVREGRTTVEEVRRILPPEEWTR